ncbi:hypothetical protein [Roseateles chitosanitabidus]|uniref:hypothetical protein n=1 Tax=Roseateles chitosanitabidus TaxID=65048 RepID=UPI0011DFAF04|nr:hypothetical protein [Roseateles chitosanitabidus]MBO9687102.1 hypothetical protein [Roseateles chitosanitabidus]
MRRLLVHIAILFASIGAAELAHAQAAYGCQYNSYTSIGKSNYVVGDRTPIQLSAGMLVNATVANAQCLPSAASLTTEIYLQPINLKLGAISVALISQPNLRTYEMRGSATYSMPDLPPGEYVVESKLVSGLGVANYFARLKVAQATDPYAAAKSVVPGIVSSLLLD